MKVIKHLVHFIVSWMTLFTGSTAGIVLMIEISKLDIMGYAKNLAFVLITFTTSYWMLKFIWARSR